ncbi:hypothetical protein Pmani_020196 [Petrolisthes manimaculis]|uniref:Uncharacterized protein n=1 Tax=Petrolisthes manimaculis TaxID=1843537 RepID=A0AAE1PGS5_9EUCA|nr:hypothetical protein Pmani_020196 [Petrolisthes manimaculis]
MLHNADHTYAWRGQDGEVIVDPVDVEVQTDPNDCNAPRKEASTLMNTTSQWTLSSEAEQEGAFRKAFIRSILASDTAVKKFTGLNSKQNLNYIFEMIEKNVAHISYWRGQKPVTDENTPSGKSRLNSKLTSWDDLRIVQIDIVFGEKHRKKFERV